MPIRFRFSLLPFIATLTVIAIGIALAQWQTRRAAEKEAIESRLSAGNRAAVIDIGAADVAPAAIEYRRVRAKGRFVGAWPVYLDNRPYQGRAGLYLLMPLKIAGTDQAVLVARGWFARDIADRTKVPTIPVPANEVVISGMARLRAGRLFQLGRDEPLQPGAIVENADIAAFAAASGLRLKPFLIEQTNDTGDGLVRDWPRPSFGADRHRGYAFQWYGLAATAFLFFVVTGFKRGRQ